MQNNHEEVIQAQMQKIELLNAMIEGIDDKKNSDQEANKRKEKELQQELQARIGEMQDKEREVKN